MLQRPEGAITKGAKPGSHQPCGGAQIGPLKSAHADTPSTWQGVNLQGSGIDQHTTKVYISTCFASVAQSRLVAQLGLLLTVHKNAPFTWQQVASGVRDEKADLKVQE